MIGWGSSAGAALTFTIGPLAAIPAAHADGLDVIVDPIINAVDHAMTGVDALASLSSAASLDLGGLGGSASINGWRCQRIRSPVLVRPPAR